MALNVNRSTHDPVRWPCFRRYPYFVNVSLRVVRASPACLALIVTKFIELALHALTVVSVICLSIVF